jgi:glycosyltransferase involved in cell wall biosynthesis
MTYAVVIPTRHRPSHLTRCLEALSRQQEKPSEIIVVDNSEGDGATRAAAERFGASYIVETGRGISVARNTGARAASAPVVLYIDDDAVPEPTWGGTLAAAFADPTVGAATGRVLPLREDGEDDGARIGRGASVFMASNPFSLDGTSADWFERAAFGGVGIGCNMGFLRALFDEGFAFNPRAGRGAATIGGDENLAFLHVLQQGFRISYHPEAVVRHPVPSTAAEARRNSLRELSSATAFLTLLLAEEAGTRRRALRYAWEGARGVDRPWRNDPSPQGDTVSIPAFRAVLALAWGPIRYLAWRLFARSAA